MSAKTRVVATDGLDLEAIELLKKDPRVDLVVHKGVEASGLVASLENADGVVIRSATTLSGDVLAKLPTLKFIIRAGVGTDNIDMKAARELGVWVLNAPTGNFQSTAELAVGMMFACARRIPQGTEGGRQGKWLKKDLSAGGIQLSGSTLGIYGAGNIGLRVARMATALGMKVQISDPVFQKTAENPFEKVDFDTLLATSQFITIHSPLLESTKYAFNAAAFAKIKKGCVLVNCARGGIIHESDLVAALNAGQVGGVGLDVFEKEPFDPSVSPYKELLAHPAVVTTPHIGASTIQAQKAVGLETAQKISALLDSLSIPQKVQPAPLVKPEKPRALFQV